MDGARDVTHQDRDLLVLALMSGAVVALSLSGAAWGVVGIIGLINRGRRHEVS